MKADPAVGDAVKAALTAVADAEVVGEIGPIVQPTDNVTDWMPTESPCSRLPKRELQCLSMPARTQANRKPGMSGLHAMLNAMNGVVAVNVPVMREAIVHAMKAANVRPQPSATVLGPKVSATNVVQTAAVVLKKARPLATWLRKPSKPMMNPPSNPSTTRL